MIAYAATGPITSASSFVDTIERVILFPLISLMIGVAMLVFMWGAYQFVANAENDSARSDGKQHMLYGIIGFVVMFSALAILKIAALTIGCDIDTPGGCT
jgi:uncharacterized membrane protein (Fun14 family)